MQQRGQELVVVKRPVVIYRKTIGHRHITYVKTGISDGGEQVVVLGPVVVGDGEGSLAGLAVDGLGVDEGDDEAS